MSLPYLKPKVLSKRYESACNLQYSVMQSNGNSFYGDFVLDSFKKTYRDMKSEYFGIFIMKISTLRVIMENAY